MLSGIKIFMFFVVSFVSDHLKSRSAKSPSDLPHVSCKHTMSNFEQNF